MTLTNEVAESYRYNLFLDDYRRPEDIKWLEIPWTPDTEIVTVKSYEEFCAFIEDHGIPTHVSFDYFLDMPDRRLTHSIKRTGLHCAVWLIQYCKKNRLPFPSYSIHSMDKVRKEEMRLYIETSSVENHEQ